MRVRSYLNLKSFGHWPDLAAPLLLWLAMLCPAFAEKSVTLTWPANPEPDIAGYFVYYGAASGAYTNAVDAGIVTTNTVPGLVEGTTYYFTVTAYNTLGLESDPATEVSFTIPTVVPSQNSPVAGTMSATVNSSGAVLNGAVNPNGAAAAAWFEYGLDSTYGWSAGFTNLGSGSSTFWVSSALAGLLPGQTYHYHVAASNSIGVTNGTDMTFTVPAALPTAATQPATAVNLNSATLNAFINPNGAVTMAWFEYGTDSSFGASSAAINLPAGNATLGVNSSIAGLQPGVTYHFRVAANNSAGMAYGTELTFMTPQVQAGTSVTLTWPANPELDIAGYKIYYGAASGVYTDSIDVGNVTAYTVSGLASGVTYYFNVTAYNSFGLESDFAGEASLTTLTPPALPLAMTQAASDIGSDSATLNAAANPEGNDAAVYFEYGLDTSYGLTTLAYLVPAGSSGAQVSIQVNTLLAGVLYHFRVVAKTIAGKTAGDDATFATLALAPDAVTEPPDSIGLGEANFNGDVDPNGSNTTAWFEFGVDTSYGSIAGLAEVGAEDGEFTYSTLVTNLSSGVTYHYRLAASNALGITYGADMSFTTLSSGAGVSTLPATGAGSTRATLQGAANPNGTPGGAWFEYGWTRNYEFRTAAADIGQGSSFVSLSCVVSNLQPGQTWHYRLVATNSWSIQYGQDMTFDTQLTDLAAVTLPAKGIKDHNATLVGSVIPKSYPAKVYFTYGLTTDMTSTTGVISMGTGNNPVAVNKNISGLLSGSTYYYQIVASNRHDTVYGEISTFTTH